MSSSFFLRAIFLRAIPPSRALPFLVLLTFGGMTPLPAHAVPEPTRADAEAPRLEPSRFGIGESQGFNPYSDWKQIETANFRVTFPKELESAARKFSDALEEAHVLLAPRLRWTTAAKVQVVIIDNADSANGLASPFERFGIVLLATPPDNWYSIGHYDDWIRMLAYHEYTHILNMDVTSSWFYKGLRVMFGDVFLPNGAWPTWMVEGLAVYMETRLTNAGRGKSPIYEMILRTAVKDGVLDDPRFITLDKVNGENPYYPGGETAYMFGYQLWNEVARTSPRGEASLGENSYESGGRIPFFINGNLENITGKDWYQTWANWTTETRKRATQDLDRLRAKPVTSVTTLTSSGYSTLGNAPSPDGEWIAYTEESLDRRSGLHLLNLKTGQTRRVSDKSGGVGMAFTPDSRFLVFSSLRRDGVYSRWSELGFHDLKTDRTRWISSGLRARDPDVSRDGKQVIFTQTEHGTTGLAIAPLEREGDELKHGPVRRIHWPSEFGRVSNPKFAGDGKRAYFSVHPNGAAQEDLMEIDLASGGVRPIVNDGSFNRFPAVDQAGVVHFVSNRTGVDNLYRLGRGEKVEQVTNTLTGIWLPSFGPGGAYASHYSNTGWDLARIELSATPLPTENLKITGPPAPAPKPGELPPTVAGTQPVEDYTPWHSLLPRQWAPIAYWNTAGESAYGGQVMGFDAVDEHRYILGALYQTETRRPDWFALYSNRTLGPSITLRTTGSFSLLTSTLIREESELSLDAGFPFRFSHSTLTPSIGFNTERDALVSLNGSRPTLFPRYEPSVDARLRYSNTESSRLAIGPEGGRSSEIGLRRYFRENSDAWKAVISDTEHIRLADHTVLSPKVTASWASRTNFGSSGVSNVRVEGQGTEVIGTESYLLEELPLRGYPDLFIQSRFAAIGSLDLRFPLLRIFRGWGTNPFFLENLSGFAFVETAYFRVPVLGEPYLPSAGGGLKLGLQALIHIPLELGVEYRKGFRDEVGGTSEVMLGLGLGTFTF